MRPFLFAALLLASCHGHRGGELRIEKREWNGLTFVRLEGLDGWMGIHEVTCDQWIEYLNHNPDSNWPGTPSFQHMTTGQWQVKVGFGRMPVSGVSPEDAQEYCRWFSRYHQISVARLPTEAEWEVAARGGLMGVRYAWGWEPPSGRACFASSSPCSVGRFPANRAGIFDMCGNLWEWCGTNGVARGGSWSERSEILVAVDSRRMFSPNYRDRDAGFRVFIAAPP